MIACRRCTVSLLNCQLAAPSLSPVSVIGTGHFSSLSPHLASASSALVASASSVGGAATLGFPSLSRQRYRHRAFQLPLSSPRVGVIGGCCHSLSCPSSVIGTSSLSRHVGIIGRECCHTGLSLSLPSALSALGISAPSLLSSRWRVLPLPLSCPSSVIGTSSLSRRIGIIGRCCHTLSAPASSAVAEQ